VSLLVNIDKKCPISALDSLESVFMNFAERFRIENTTVNIS